MRYTVLTIFFSLSILSATSQTSRGFLKQIPAFKQSNIGGYRQNLWFLPYLTENFTEFVTFKEFTGSTHRKEVLSLAVKGDSAFIVTQTNFPLDTPKLYTTKKLLSNSDFNKVVDSLKWIGAFTLKDEGEVRKCVRTIETMIDGKKVFGTSTTSDDIYDGLQTLLIFYSHNKFRFTSYYELETAKKWCPELNEWMLAIKTRNLVKSLFEKYRREGTWRRKGMTW